MLPPLGGRFLAIHFFAALVQAKFRPPNIIAIVICLEMPLVGEEPVETVRVLGLGPYYVIRYTV